MIIKRDDDRAKYAEEALEANGGYCPCRLEKIPKNKCMCREFQKENTNPTTGSISLVTAPVEAKLKNVMKGGK